MSSKFTFQVYLNAYSDANSSNEPSLNNFQWLRALNSVSVNNPQAQQFTLAPGEVRQIFNGTRTLAQDGTTTYSLSLKPLTQNTYVLTAVSGTLPNFRTPRSIASDATTHVSVTLNGPLSTFTSALSPFASYTGHIAGMTTDVTVTAATRGSVGNAISLAFDGSTDVATALAAWNTANPSNTASATGDLTQIPTIGGTIVLSGGADWTQWNLASVQVGDCVSIGNAFNVRNQGVWKVLSKTSTSFTVENELASAEGPIALGSSFASQIAPFGAAGVQIGDTLIISSGFSSVTQGSYKITAVYANSVEFYSLSVLPLESNIQTEVAAYWSAKQLIYVESDQNADLTINGADGGTVEPFANGSVSQPGVFMRKSTMYSLAITNTSTTTATVFVASVE